MAKSSKEIREDRKTAKDIAKSVVFDHPAMHTGHATKAKKITAAVAYMLGNSARESAQIAGVSRGSINEWRNHTDWWPQLIDHLKRTHDADLEARTTAILDNALNKLEERIEKGDVSVSRDGEVTEKPVSGRDMAIIFGTLYDKRQLMRSQPTSISETTSEAARLSRLADRFEALASQREPETIEGEYREYDDNDRKLRSGVRAGPRNEEEENRAKE